MDANKKGFEFQVIVPAAGFGTRVGSPNSKEMLLGIDQRPLISSVVDFGQKNQLPIHIITRKEKTDLIQYLSEKNVSIQLITPSKEWPDTVLQSEPFWKEWNLLYLPDISYSPKESLKDAWLLLQSQIDIKLCFLTFAVSDPMNWGCLKITDGEELKTGLICEKPRMEEGPMFAWGFIFFHQSVGRELLERLLESNQDHQWKTLSEKFITYPLQDFKDLTR